MRTAAISGIVFANNSDDSLKKLTAHRSVASVPFGARYRLIDFALSNLVNAGAIDVGVIIKEKYRSLMDHVGNGSAWELDRKNGGLYLLPPFSTSSSRRNAGTVDALYGALGFINRCKSDCIVLCNSDIVANVDIQSAIGFHNEKKSDITFVCCDKKYADETRENMFFSAGKDGRIAKADFGGACGGCDLLACGIMIISKQLLIDFIVEAHENECVDFYKDFIAGKIAKYKVFGFMHDDYICFMSHTNMYFKANMDLLTASVRKSLFNPERPIFTKSRDDMPTRYGTKSSVSNAVIGDGCVIDGEVRNCVLFRGVKIEKGATVENSILMQGTVVGRNAELSGVIADKNAVIGESVVLKGSKDRSFFVKKNQVV